MIARTAAVASSSRSTGAREREQLLLAGRQVHATCAAAGVERRVVAQGRDSMNMAAPLVRAALSTTTRSMLVSPNVTFSSSVPWKSSAVWGTTAIVLARSCS